MTTQPSTQASAPSKSNGLAIASLSLGIISVISLTGFVTGIPAIILGIIALQKKAGEKSMSIIGIITGGFSTVVSILAITTFILIATYDEPSPRPSIDSSETEFLPSSSREI
jgi:hypothetical protein